MRASVGISVCARAQVREGPRVGEGVTICPLTTHSEYISMETRGGCDRNTPIRQEGQPDGGVEAGCKQLPLRTERRRVSSSPRFVVLIYLFVRSFVRSFVVHPFVRSFIRSFVRPSVRSSVRSFVRSFVLDRSKRRFVRPFVRPFPGARPCRAPSRRPRRPDH